MSVFRPLHFPLNFPLLRYLLLFLFCLVPCPFRHYLLFLQRYLVFDLVQKLEHVPLNLVSLLLYEICVHEVVGESLDFHELYLAIWVFILTPFIQLLRVNYRNHFVTLAVEDNYGDVYFVNIL